MCALYCAGYEGTGAFQQWRGQSQLQEQILRGRSGEVAWSPLRPGDLVGRIEIPRLQMSAIIFEGTDETQLIRGVGHWTASSPTPGRGNLVLAAHRDTFFRELRKVRAGDEIVVAAPSGEATYRVSSLNVVSPGALEVLDPTAQPTLTLITCYPFDILGRAPDRFIVRAVSASE